MASAEMSNPVTRCPRCASAMLCRPLPHGTSRIRDRGVRAKRDSMNSMSALVMAGDAARRQNSFGSSVKKFSYQVDEMCCDNAGSPLGQEQTGQVTRDRPGYPRAADDKTSSRDR